MLGYKEDQKKVDLEEMLDNDAFDAAFKSHVKDEKTAKDIAGKSNQVDLRESMIGKQDHIEVLMQQSKQFWVKGRQYLYKDDDRIFFLREPVY